MPSLTNTAETNVANWLAGQPNAATEPVLPYQVALLTANGDDNVQGTEVTGGDYQRQTVTFGATSTDMIANDDLVRFNNLPAVTVVGAEVYDSAPTPVRWFHGPLATSRELVAGDPVEFNPGTLTVTLD